MNVNKLEFINALGEKLSILPPGDIQGILDYYVESIDDKTEDGMDEESAIASLGSIDDLSVKILSEQSALTLSAAPEAPKGSLDHGADSTVPPKKRIGPGIIVLLVLGSPIWLSLGIAAFAIVLVLYIVVWAMLGSLFIAAAALAVCTAGAVLSFFVPVYPNTISMRVLSCGICILAGGLGFLLLPASVSLIRGFAHLHTLLFRKLRNKKEAV